MSWKRLTIAEFIDQLFEAGKKVTPRAGRTVTDEPDYIKIGHYPDENPKGVSLFVITREMGFRKKDLSSRDMPKYDHYSLFPDLSDVNSDDEVIAQGRVEYTNGIGSVQYYLPSEFDKRISTRILKREYPGITFFGFDDYGIEVLERTQNEQRRNRA